MKLDGRVLALSEPLMIGSDVDRLHEELSYLGDSYRQLLHQDVDREGRRQFGEGAKRAVTTFQEANRQRLQAVVAGSLDGTEEVRWSGVWGAVDPATAQAINDEVARLTEPRVVRGRVEHEDGTPAEGIRVTVYDRDIAAFKEELGKRGGYLTNASGAFPDVQYASKAHATGEGRQGASADLVFEVAAVDRESAVELIAVYRQIGLPGRTDERPVSDLVLGWPAAPLETVRLVVRRRGASLPSEYERLMSALRPLLIRETTPDQFDEEQHRDLSFAARETREDRTLIETISQAWKLSKATELPPELFYGLLRHGPPTTAQPMPPEMAALLSYGRVVWEAKLTEAFELRLIPAAMKGEMPKWLDQLQHRRAQAALHATPDQEERVSVADVLTHAGIRSERHAAFAALLGDHEGLADDFWKKIADQLHWAPTEIQAVQNALELSEVLSSYKPLLAQLHARETSPSARMLASWDRGILEDLIARAGAPADVPGETPEDRRKEYLDDIESQLRVLYPAVYVAKVLRHVEDRDIRRAGDRLHGMLSQTRSLPRGVPAFDLVTTPATGYLRDHGDRLFANVSKEERAQLSSQLKRVQRVFQLSATPEQMPQLFQEKLESAHHIVRWSHEHFVQQYGDRLGGAEAAAAVHSKAGYIHGTLLNLYVDVWKMFPARLSPIDVPGEMHTLGASVHIPSLHEVDLALSLFPLSDPFTLILRLADIKGLLDDLKIPIDQLFALWDRIDTWDESSLFERLFRSKTAQSLDPLFKLDDVRREIDAFVKSPGSPPLLKDHAPLLLAAFRIGSADLALLLATLSDGNLNLENVSALYRLVVLSKALDLPVADLLALQELSGVNPVERPVGQIESTATVFVRIARAVQSSGFTVPRLDYLFRHRRDARDGDLLTPEQQRGVIGTIRVGLEDIQREFVVKDDPQGDELVRQLGAVLSPQVAETLARMVYGRIAYSQLLPKFPLTVSFPPSVANKVGYDADRQEIRFAGVMTPAEQAVLKATSFVNSLPLLVRVPFTKAVDDLFGMPETFAKQKLFDLMDSGDLVTLLRSQSSLGVDGTVNLPAVAVKVAAVLSQVRRFLSMSLIKRSLSDAFKLEGPAVTALPEDDEVLRDLNVGGGHPAIEDFLDMSGSGVHAAYFPNPSLMGAPVAQRVEPAVNFDGTTALPAGVGPGPFSVRWTGYLYAPLTEDFTFVVRVRDAIRVWLNGALVLDEWKAQPVTELMVPTKLRKGSVNELTIEHAHFAGAVIVELWWRSPSTELALVPAAALYTEDALQIFIAPLVRLEKIAVRAGSPEAGPDADSVAGSRRWKMGRNGVHELPREARRGRQARNLWAVSRRTREGAARLRPNAQCPVQVLLSASERVRGDRAPDGRMDGVGAAAAGYRQHSRQRQGKHAFLFR